MKYLLALVCAAVFTLGLPMMIKHPDGAPYMTYTQEDALQFSTYTDAYEGIYRTLANDAGNISRQNTGDNNDSTEMKAWRDNRGVWHFTDPHVSNPEIFEDHIIDVENDANRDLYSAPKPSQTSQPDFALTAVMLMFMIFFTFSVLFMTLAYLLGRKTREED